MIRLLDTQLRRWAADPDIACVILHGAGEKAFCAGGDIRSLYYLIKEHSGTAPDPRVVSYFTDEYRLDHSIHRYPKPLLVWGSGIVLGGGLGLMAGASHRVVTETSRIGMPEVTIGLFPDVGASWFLQRMPLRTGLFMALTGVQINAHDAIAGGLADHFLRSADRQTLFARLAGAMWTSDPNQNRAMLSALLRDLADQAGAAMPTSNFQAYEQEILAFCQGESVEEMVSRIVGYNGTEEWLKRASATLAAGSPTSAVLGFELQRRTRSLADAFRLELIVTLQCCARHDLAEGIRALLIDKDRRPQWRPRTIEEITPQWIDGHFAAPVWPDSRHPLADL
jgi:enoyl-CoA hydratase/carnithine racemase